MTDQTIGKTILEQMGGAGKIMAMIGVKQFVTMGEDLKATPKRLGGVMFKWGMTSKNRANSLTIILAPDDTYTMTFHRISNHGMDCKVVGEFEDVYADSLRTIFEDCTGLRLSL